MTDILPAANNNQRVRISDLGGGRWAAYTATDELYYVLEEPEPGVLTQRFIGFVDQPLHLMALEHGLLARFAQGGYRYVIADLRRMMGMYDMKHPWIVNTLFPALLQLGLRATATLLSADILNRLATERAEEFTGDFPMQYFNEEQDALDWLRSLD